MKRLSIYLMVGAAFFIYILLGLSGYWLHMMHCLLPPPGRPETDAESFVVGCYNGLWDPTAILYLDCGSDIALQQLSVGRLAPLG